MNSIKCPQCTLTNWADATLCKRCGFELTVLAPHADWQPGDNLQSDYSQQYYPSPVIRSSAALKTGLAITSMVLGIVAIVSCGFGILVAPVGLILGIVALVKANKSAHVYGGRGFAITGIATSVVSLFVVVPLIAAIAIPNFMAARQAADESSALSTVAAVAAAEQSYILASRSIHCADLETLASKKLIDHTLANGEKMGYRFTVVDESDGEVACGVQATPISHNSWRSFYFSTNDGLMRAARKDGSPANRNDPMLGSELQQNHR